MYTWGYIKEATLAKLDLSEGESNTSLLLQRFPYFANEAITQISSAVKPKRSHYEVLVDQNKIGIPVKMPSDFISFGDDVNIIAYQDCDGSVTCREAYDDDFTYLGNNHVIFKRVGSFQISYNARWIGNFIMLSDEVLLDIPADILDALPSYIASQCLKIDDEYKSSVYRNEYEMFLARIDDVDYKNTKTFKIGGDW